MTIFIKDTWIPIIQNNGILQIINDFDNYLKWFGYYRMCHGFRL